MRPKSLKKVSETFSRRQWWCCSWRFVALTLNHQPDHYATLTKKSKSKILQISKTIIRPDRPQIFKRRQDSDSEDDDDVGTVAKDDYSDLLDDVLGKASRQISEGLPSYVF